MRFEEKLKTCSAKEIWGEYCGFLDLSLEAYMEVQRRLLMEQVHLMAGCALGQKLMKGRLPRTVEEFREMVPLTTYQDYADVLLLKAEKMLPAPPVTWLKTTWEGGDYPAKVAPYSKGMLETYLNNILAAMILSTSEGRGKFRVKPNARVLYALAPMPYATGLFPELIAGEMSLRFLPPVKEALRLSFGAQSRRGFELAAQQGMDQFFGMSAVLYHVSRSLLAGGGGGKGQLLRRMRPRMLARAAAAQYRARRDGTELLPRDLFRLDGFVCVGTDSRLYKDELTRLWGHRPLELAGGTEPSCMGTETWSKDGLVFFPDACFYEFIPEAEMLRSLKDPGYVPRTNLMDELCAGEKYELVITVLKGGAFARYRVGDVYRCLRLSNPSDGLALPQFEYVDRIPTVIDIAGFTRITRREIDKVMEFSRLPVKDWFAFKQYDENKCSFLHLVMEMQPEAIYNQAVSAQIIKEHLSIYFRYYDSDYTDLKRLLGVEPLKVSLVAPGTMERFRRIEGHAMDKINPPMQDLIAFRKIAGGRAGERA
jgi:hypothetical protein